MGFVLAGEKGAVTKGKRLDFDEISVGAENRDRRESVLLGGDGVGGDSDRGDGRDTLDIRNSLDISESETGFLERVGRGEFVDDIGKSVFGSAGANDNEVGADFGDFALDEVGDATHQRENQNNTSYTDGDTKTSEERPGAVFFDGGLGEFVVST